MAVCFAFPAHGDLSLGDLPERVCLLPADLPWAQPPLVSGKARGLGSCWRRCWRPCEFSPQQPLRHFLSACSAVFMAFGDFLTQSCV